MRKAAVLGSLLAAAWVLALPESSQLQFRDIASEIGINGKNTYGGLRTKDYILETTGNGAAIFDYDGDGRNDVLITNGTTLEARKTGAEPRLQLYHNDGNGHFTDVATKAGLTSQGWAQGVCVGDYDNDGHPDMLVTYYGHNVLYRNRGDGTFEDVTEKAHLPVVGVRYGSGCTFIDYDRDGYLDLFVSNYVNLDLAKTPRPGQGGFCEWKGIPVMCGPRGLPLASNILYHNNGNGTFEDVSEKSGILKPGGRYGLGAVAADFDGDGWPDIYVACDMTPSLLFHNLHNGTFEERGVEAGVAYNFDGQLQAGMGVAVGDYDGDGRLDIAKTNFSGDLSSLFHNDDGKFFTDVSREAGLGVHQLLGWGVAFVDVDNDGWPDLVEVNGHVYPEVEGKQLGDSYYEDTVLYHNRGNGKFEDISASAGPAFRPSRPARGLAVGDIDGDGQPELVIVNMNATPSVLHNDAPSRWHSVNVELTGTKSNRSAIGALATITAGGRTRVAPVLGGSSFYSQNAFALHFGLGAATRVDQLEVRWPCGEVERWQNLGVDRTLKAVEGRARVEEIPFERAVRK
ncbi:MAG: CRTAC1 family protein [Bryobacteraceae bacterium]